ncbi:MAG: HAMP domain-containing histidine kinase [Chitinophagaceae bacterium]|uniref:sensor histidine kinase n=1 Tax=unclassified Paraflavitalea TaxID=2798305 RepID=UPI003D343328|nr:HAMP domain-containing histidine kinase [Chitinophagaceae bacterium]
MISNKRPSGFTILIKVILLTITLLTASFLFVKGWYVYELIVVPIIIFQIVDFYRFHNKAQREVEDFVQSVHYRDFSRSFNVKQAPTELQPLRRGFNDINSAFKLITKEKETQYQYLQNILELVDTGILSYELETGEVLWMNETLKKLLNIPYLKTIQSLERRDETLYQDIINLKAGNNIVTVIHHDKTTLKILLSATSFQTGDQKYKLIAFQNVNEALDETESKAWQKLLSVMTHEIMNSVAPISSLAGTLQNRLQQSESELDESSREDLELGISTIKKRSDGLLKFTETYRSLNKITKADVSKVFVHELFDNIQRLMHPTLLQKNIELEIILKDPLLTIEVDINLIEQVLINLLTNAIDAVKERAGAKIVLQAQQENKKVQLKVIDNGAGIPAEIADKIFIPFFSTKKSGSGIGLSLCKQIMLIHRGTIQVNSKEGEGTVFTLVF